MKIKTLAAAVALSVGSIAANAGPINITNADGTFNFTGFDWAQGGTAYTIGFVPVAGDLFSLQYFAYGVSLQNTPTTFVPAGMDINANGVADAGKSYEYTIVATLNEQVVSCTATSCIFDVLSGVFNVYYDLSPDAQAGAGLLGTGFADGVGIIGGTVNPLAGQTFSLTTGINTTLLQGVVTSTNATYITPPLLGTTAVTTLQIGQAVTNWVDPGGYAGVAWVAGTQVFQSDGNQSFTAVPEPTSLALLGLGLAGLGFLRRRT